MNSNAELLFVTGASRSGTTMLNRVLGSHSDILGMNELHYFGDIWSPCENDCLSAQKANRLGAWILSRQAGGIWGGGPGQADVERAEQLLRSLPSGATGKDVYAEVVSNIAARAGKRIACEQTPRNIFYAKYILDAYENARVIQLIRDPRSVVASQKNRWKRRKLGGRSTPLSEIVRVWMNYHPYTMTKLWMNAANTGEALKGHSRFIQIRFEDLITKPEETIRKLCQFIGVDFQAGMLDVPIVGSSQRKDEGRKGFSAESVDSWRNVLSAAELWTIERTAGDVMARYGYAPLAMSPGLGLAAIVARYPLHAMGVALSNPRRAWIQVRALLGAR